MRSERTDFFSTIIRLNRPLTSDSTKQFHENIARMKQRKRKTMQKQKKKRNKRMLPPPKQSKKEKMKKREKKVDI